MIRSYQNHCQVSQRKQQLPHSSETLRQKQHQDKYFVYNYANLSNYYYYEHFITPKSSNDLQQELQWVLLRYLRTNLQRDNPLKICILVVEGQVEVAPRLLLRPYLLMHRVQRKPPRNLLRSLLVNFASYEKDLVTTTITTPHRKAQVGARRRN